MLTQGGAPSDQQRKRWDAALRFAGAPSMPCAVMTDHLMARMAIRGLQLLKHKVARFSCDDLEGAMSYLGELPASAQRVHGALAAMCRELGLDIPRAPGAAA